MADDQPADPSLPSTSSPENARQRFEAIAKERMENASEAIERSLWQGGYSGKAMYGTWLLSGVVTILLLVAIGMLAADNSTAWLIVGAAILLWWCFVIGVYLYRRFSVHYELTTQRFIHQAGLLSRKTDRIEVIDINDVSYTQGVIQRMLGVGTIQISSSDKTDPELYIRGIDRVPEVASLIDDVRREERRSRSLRIDSV